MNSSLYYEDFLEQLAFRKGQYLVCAVQEGARRPLVTLTFPEDDQDVTRQVAAVGFAQTLEGTDKARVARAVVRAGARHPGLRHEDICALHREANRARHVELFADLNALNTGTLTQLVDSIGPAIARVVVSSSEIDVLHEYQAGLDKGAASEYRRRSEMARCLRLLDEIRATTPVHVHQLPPGAARYFTRSAGGPGKTAKCPGTCGGCTIQCVDEDRTYISEDRQMVGAFWDYLGSTKPRLPVRFVTCDFSLAKVCAAESVPFIFAKSPFEVWRSVEAAKVVPEVLWYDPFALAFRYALPHRVIWELGLVYEKLLIESSVGAGFSIQYDSKAHFPGTPAELVLGEYEEVPLQAEKPGGPIPAKASDPKASPEKPRSVLVSDRGLKLPFKALIDVLPTRVGQEISLTEFRPKDKDVLRQLRQVGEWTSLYEVTETHVVGGASLAELHEALTKKDYVRVNAIFRRVPAYDRTLRFAEHEGTFPRGGAGGAANGWAVVLGASFKTSEGVYFGLAAVDDEVFEQGVVSAHREQGKGLAAVSLPPILERVCRNLQVSPVRFEAMLEVGIGKGALLDYEVQLATISHPLSPHPVLTLPRASNPRAYIHEMKPGSGITINGRFVSSLVRRSGVK